jgi:hypothetical protein
MPDWNDVLKEIHSTIAQHATAAQIANQNAQTALDTIRRKYLLQLREAGT